MGEGGFAPRDESARARIKKSVTAAALGLENQQLERTHPRSR
jgi:hypothetical protein